MYFHKKSNFIRLIFETNTFKEMIICVAVDSNNDIDKGKPKFLQIFKGRKSVIALAHKKN